MSMGTDNSRVRSTRVWAREAFTLAEAVISTAIVGIMMAAALACVAQTAKFRHISNDQQLASALANQLMAEILSKAYVDPGADSTALGLEEAVTGNRLLFDDVDDYDGWIESPCKLADGTELANGSGWYRKVDVAFTSYADLDATAFSDTGLKRITVEVGRLRAGGSAADASDRTAVLQLKAIAGQGRGIQ